jgi:hypothetical protein
MKVELYNRVWDRKSKRSLELDKIIERAQVSDELKDITLKYRQWLVNNPSATESQKTEYKTTNFYNVQFAGTFKNTGRAEDINTMSGLIVIDFDHIDVNEFWDKLSKEIYTYLMFISPSGDGIKVVMKHNLKDPLKWKYLFKEIQDYYRKFTNIDGNGCDICRMCNLPFMDRLHRNDKSYPWIYKGHFEENLEYEAPRTEITQKLIDECSYYGRFLSENKINITEPYGNWIKFGFSLASLGEQGRKIFHNMSNASDKYNYKECDNKYSEILENYDPDKISIDAFLSTAKTGIGETMIHRTYHNEEQ